MLNRREFVRGVAAGAAVYAGANWIDILKASPYGLPVGLQLYSVRAELAKDVPGTIKKVAEAGYQQVELAGQNLAQINPILKANNLVAVSGHYGLQQIGANWQKEVEIAHAGGLKYMVNAFLEGRDRKSLDDYKRVSQEFNKAGEACKQAGIKFCYHNHNFEFSKFGDTMGYDVLLKETDPKAVNFELDCFWMVHAGHDPVDYFHNHPGRFPLLHIKDLKPGLPPTVSLGPTKEIPFTDVGKGIIDWKRLFTAAKGGGLENFFVEKDASDEPIFEAIKISSDYLHNLNV